jgi:transposase-like protein
VQDRERGWETRVGELELQIPKLRSGPAYFPSFLEPRRRAEQAPVSVVQEASVNGVSTRKVDRVVEQLGVRMSKDHVSRLCRRLDEQVAAFRERPLEGARRSRDEEGRRAQASRQRPANRGVRSIRGRQQVDLPQHRSL